MLNGTKDKKKSICFSLSFYLPVNMGNALLAMEAGQLKLKHCRAQCTTGSSRHPTQPTNPNPPIHTHYRPHKRNPPWPCPYPLRPFCTFDGCVVCWSDEDAARNVLCDGCECEYHTYCLDPPLEDVPQVRDCVFCIEFGQYFGAECGVQ